MRALFLSLAKFYYELAQEEGLPDMVTTEFLGRALIPIGKGPMHKLVNENPNNFTIIPLWTLYVMN